MDEDQIPNLDATRIAGVNERSARIARRGEIDVQFGTRTARAGIAHHPEVVRLVPVHDMNRRIEIGFAKQSRPMIVRFLIELARLARTRFVNGRVKSLRRKFPTIDHQFPRPLDRFLLEIIAEAPVAEHLEKRVVIGVEADVLEVVMLAAGANAFLRVGHARRIPRGLLLPQKNRHELIHACVREKQIRRIRQKR